MLFPNVFLPLHIFEPRYREMVADALDGDRMIGMVLLKPGWEGEYEGNSCGNIKKSVVINLRSAINLNAPVCLLVHVVHQHVATQRARGVEIGLAVADFGDLCGRKLTRS